MKESVENLLHKIENNRVETFDYEDKQHHFVGSHFDAFLKI